MKIALKVRHEGEARADHPTGLDLGGVLDAGNRR